MTDPKPEEGVDLPIDIAKYEALVAEDKAQWEAFRTSDLGTHLLGGLAAGMTEED